MLIEQRFRLKWAHFEKSLRERSTAHLAMSARNRVRRILLEPSLRRAYERRAKRHRPSLPVLSADMQVVLDAIAVEGVYVGPVGSLNIPGTDEIIRIASALAPKLAKSPPTRPSKFMVHADRADLQMWPEFFLWGLDDKLLDLVENHLGVPVGFNNVNVNRSIANDVQEGTRLWHLDSADHRMFRIIIYLNDVDSDNAAFEYISRKRSNMVRRALNYSNESVSDGIMRNMVPDDHWTACVGPRGTMIIADPANVFHRSKVPQGQERFALFYSYQSAEPMHERYMDQWISPEFFSSIENKLNSRQRACVFWRK